MTNNVSTNARTGSLIALAFGDAWGDRNEFSSYSRLTVDSLQGPSYPATRARITDDTQMSFAVYDAITEAVTPEGDFGVDDLGKSFARAFAAWSVDLDNNRAPGNACMAACRSLQSTRPYWVKAHTRVIGGEEVEVEGFEAPGRTAKPWDEAGGPSLGCGTVMRAPWIGVHPHISENMGALALVAQLSAVVTHTHPGAIAAAEVTAVVTRALATGSLARADVIEYVESYALTGGPLGWRRTPTVVGRFVPETTTLDEFIEDGWSRVLAGVADAKEIRYRLARDPWGFDPCEVTNHGAIKTGFMGQRRCEGWDAISCLAIALGILASDLEAFSAVRRATVTNGDSDSIAACLGGMLGAWHGASWPENTEYVVLTPVLSTLEPRYADALAVRSAYNGWSLVPAPVFVQK